MESPPGNSHKARVPEPEVKRTEKVVVGKVITRKKPLGRKFKDIFVGHDARSVASYVCMEVIVPSVRNLVVDASTKGIERMMYGDDAPRRRGTVGPSGYSRISYNSPINRDPRGPIPTRGRPSTRDPRDRQMRTSRDDIILSDRGEAELVLERLGDVLEMQGYTSLGDLYDLLGLPTSHTDNKWGWYDLRGVHVRQIREGYLIDFPQPEAVG